MPWLYLGLTILFEVAGTTCMKLSQGFSQVWPSIGMAVFYGASLTFLTLTLKKLDVSIAYAIWSGVGTALIAAIGMLWFREPVTFLKLVSIGLIIAGVAGLKLAH
ncbi:MAG: multidrug efflux SMR transporter [Aphanocapsa sp. GSE-SYN-MK-11-07L]|jgi:small multidrug resistance pump|nr:multidrug efflux SMR transporter [Aphanocapsa sp. GSE-SYN-MK-11-07L]